MEGIFRKRLKQYGLSLVLIIAGSFVAVKFGLWGVDAIRSGKAAAAIFSFAFTAIGILSGLSSILLFNFNKGAFLTVDEHKIDARFGYGSELHESVANIKKAELLRGGTGLSLYFPNRICQIGNLANAKEICSFIRSVNAVSHTYMTVDEATANLNKYKKKYVGLLTAAFAVVVLLFVHIAWCVVLTEGKDLGDFSQRDDLVFVGFAVAELVTLAGAFLLADRCGKMKRIYEFSRFTLVSAAATEHKYDSIDRYPSVVGKKYFDDNTFRIIIYTPESGKYAYVQERFVYSQKTWVHCYEGSRVFDDLSALYDEIDESHEDVLFVD